MSHSDPASVLAVIPARGGSKGIPGKNIRPLAGRPLIAHTISAARRASTVGRVVVSTDDDEIARVAREAGADVVRRPAEISTDTAPSEAAVRHAIESLRESEGYEPEIVVFLQCTSPLTVASDIDGTVGVLVREEADSALAVSAFAHFVWERDACGDAIGINHAKGERQMRQQRPAQYLETGSVYAFRAAGFLRAGHRFFGRTAMHEIPASRCLEIDEPADLERAEAIMRASGVAPGLADVLPDPVGALVLDFDGVMTDNAVLVDQDGHEAVRCSRGDGMGLGMLKDAGVPLLVLSKERNPVVAARCAKLGLECEQGIDDKPRVLRAWIEARSIPAGRVVYVGNDVNDLGCFRIVGCPVAVADAHPDALREAAAVTRLPGGHGAVREVADAILARVRAGRG